MISSGPAAFEGLARLIVCSTSSGVCVVTLFRRILAVCLLILRRLWHPLDLMLDERNCLPNMLLRLLESFKVCLGSWYLCCQEQKLTVWFAWQCFQICADFVRIEKLLSTCLSCLSSLTILVLLAFKAAIPGSEGLSVQSLSHRFAAQRLQSEGGSARRFSLFREGCGQKPCSRCAWNSCRHWWQHDGAGVYHVRLLSLWQRFWNIFWGWRMSCVPRDEDCRRLGGRRLALSWRPTRQLWQCRYLPVRWR